MRTSCRDASIVLQEMVTHEAAELATPKIGEATRSRSFSGAQKHQHLNLGVYIGLLPLAFVELALKLIQSPSLAQNGFDCGCVQSQFEDAERLD